ncbi:MAG: hypothetical protein C0403_19705, partial [Desulfobacterium sp.]|nr:hypothetical protein [Desulfobacterium sp.]
IQAQVTALAAAQYEAGALAQGLPAAQAAAYGQQQGAIAGATAAALVSVDDPSSATPLNTQNASLQWAPRFAEGLRLSGTWLFTEIDMTLNITTPNSTLTGVNTVATTVDIENVSSIVGSVEYTRGDTILSAEYNMIRVDVGDIFGSDVPTTEVLGWAVSASHRFTYWFELGAYYGDWVTNDRDRDGSELEGQLDEDGRPRFKEERWMRDACLTTRFDLNENWIFKLEGHYMSGLDDVDFGNDPDPDPDWFLFASKVSYNF